MNKMNGMNFSDVKLKRVDQVKTLSLVTNAITPPSKKHVNMDPLVLFNRLLVIMQRSHDMAPYFAYKLSAQPTALLKDNYMRKTYKSQLAKEMWIHQ
jgi:hypothetical protein